MIYFASGETERACLRRKDKRLGAVIDRIGHIDPADTDLFSSVIHQIIGQQISIRTSPKKSLPALLICAPWSA